MDAIQSFLTKHNITSTDQLQELATCVAAIPWGEARTVDEVLEKGYGTCTGKHLLLQACFDELGIIYRPVVCTFRWSEQGIHLPEHLQEILDEGAWVHGHNFVQAQGSNKEWIDLDITWDPPLQKYGFLSLPKNWDGSESFVGLQSMVERWDGVSISEKKKDLIEALSPEQRDRRERFLHGFIEWIASLR